MGETIVVGYDGGEPAKRALDRAIELAKAGGGRLVIAAAYALPFDPLILPGEYGNEVPAPLPVADPLGEPAALKPIVDEALARAGSAGLTAESVTGAGDPARVILDAAKDNGASKIVIGGEHHSWFGKLFGDDVEGEVKREAGCDVVVVD
jgi:nucleotide-binding universal stress UspA family protein